MKMPEKILAVILSVVMFGSSASSQVRGYGQNEQSLLPQNQYTFLPSTQTHLIDIRLLGAVNRPGIHYVPGGTDLLSLLTLAGGPHGTADLEKLTVKRKTKDFSKTYDLNLMSMLEEEGKAKDFILQRGDIVVMYPKENIVNQDVTSIISLVGAITSVVLSVVLLRRELSSDK